MAITKQHSKQYKDAYIDGDSKNYTTDMAGRVRIIFFDFEQKGAGDQGSSFIICKLPAGRVRLLSRSSIIFGTTVTSNTLTIGWDAYNNASNHEVAASVDGVGFSKSAGTAAMGYHLGNNKEGGTKLFESQAGVSIRAISKIGAIADTNEIKGYLMYVVD
ncbi:MAG: hypothetical protein KZQ66_13120 [Candidatus Thiodiazotropha sp. (ex Lucinoma aequizonata)]|nr:hypothetical protein [Candidatus Thiodiazotropha sp. (ex Lucinoma aequizonata)]MCU7895113.1 hypothetical protein [Candidatus Thiodiazotropha sp. (ex Lucinoma aequizonata)]MCU7902817.1 hypothetical protein [Candidatus Thiodiazotropha sp. (ex Lucinoma aequizonata)]MCU7912666.1 hypothetical protein [Candidatus Thiodiazotropha sp. (ex Lucinoma aequizonata)]